MEATFKNNHLDQEDVLNDLEAKTFSSRGRVRCEEQTEANTELLKSEINSDLLNTNREAEMLHKKKFFESFGVGVGRRIRSR